MLGNYLKVAWRNLNRYKGYTAINILGLAIGMACCLLIALYVRHETSFDAFHQNGDHIYRLVLEDAHPRSIAPRNTLLPDSLAVDIATEVPGVIRATGFASARDWIGYQGRAFEETVGLVSPSFLQMFSFHLLAGDPATALAQRDQIVLSRRLAQKLTGSSDDFARIVGQTVEHKGSDYTVAGILRDPPSNSSLSFDFLVPMGRWNYFLNTAWSGRTAIFVQLRPDQATAQTAAAMWPLAERRLGGRTQLYIDYLDAAGTPAADLFSISLQPLRDIYLNRDIPNRYVAGSDAFYSQVLAAIAALVLLMACVNFAVLSIGRSASRSAEIGVRKVLGARRGHLARQFWGETLLTCALALALGVGLAELFLPVFNELAQKQLSIPYLASWDLPLALLAILAATSLVAGGYPVTVLSRLQPVALFKGGSGAGGGNRLGKGLLIGQYSLVAFLVVCLGTMLLQLDFMRDKDLGFDQEQVAVVPVPGEQVANRYKAALAERREIVATAGSDRSFTSGWQAKEIRLPGRAEQRVRTIRVDADYIDALGLRLIAGRDFDPDRSTDVEEAVVVNQTLVRVLGLDEPLGTRLPGLEHNKGLPPPVIIGVVADFHFDSLHRGVEPLVLSTNPAYHGIYHVFARLRPGDPGPALAALETTWGGLETGRPFEFSFLDHNLDIQYRAEERWSSIVGYAAFFVVAITCLGLVGLAALTVARRTKEIGIRKVLGASVANLTGLVYREFAWLVLAANALAWPTAYWAMESWLQGFAYRIDMEAWIFVLGGSLTLALVLATVSYQSVRAARANPVETLKYE